MLSVKENCGIIYLCLKLSTLFASAVSWLTPPCGNTGMDGRFPVYHCGIILYGS